MMRQKKCGCGRSPTGNCMGWHLLTEEEYLAAKTAYENYLAGAMVDEDVPDERFAAALETLPEVQLS